MKPRIIVIIFVFGVLTLSSCRSTSTPCGLADVSPKKIHSAQSTSLLVNFDDVV